MEYVVAAWLALVAHPDSRRARLTVDRDDVVDDAAITVIRINSVSGDRCGPHVLAVAMIDVVQVAPQRAVLHTTGHTEVGLGA